MIYQKSEKVEADVEVVIAYGHQEYANEHQGIASRAARDPPVYEIFQQRFRRIFAMTFKKE